MLYNSIFKKFYDNAFGEDIKQQDKQLKEKLRDLKEGLKDAAEEYGDGLGDFVDDVIPWIISSDPVSM